MAFRPEDMFIAELGYGQRWDGDDACVGTADITDALRIPGTRLVRPSVLLTFADLAAGSLATRATMPRIAGSAP